MTKRIALPERAPELHGFAAGTYPVLKRLSPEQFTRALSTAEIALGTSLLIPVIPEGLVGAALGAFTTGLLGLYLNTPGMRLEGSLRPTDQGLPLHGCLDGRHRDGPHPGRRRQPGLPPLTNSRREGDK